MKKRENPFVSLIVNVILPVFILKKASAYDPKIALIVALSIPLAYGIWEYFKEKKVNWISVFGLINVALTGGLALMHITGIWFAIKEAALPLVLGIFVYLSAYSKKQTFFSLFIYNDYLIDKPKIEQKLKENNNEKLWTLCLKKCTQLLSLSFVLSAILNFALGYILFKDVTSSLTPEVYEQLVNAKISQMLWLSFIVISLPCMIFLVGLMMYFFKQIYKLTGYGIEDIFRQNKAPKPTQS